MLPALLTYLLKRVIEPAVPLDALNISGDDDHRKLLSEQILHDFFQTDHVPLFGSKVMLFVLSLLRLCLSDEVQLLQFVEKRAHRVVQVLRLVEVDVLAKSRVLLLLFRKAVEVLELNQRLVVSNFVVLILEIVFQIKDFVLQFQVEIIVLLWVVQSLPE